ncbi:uncharacterized protein LOC34624059 [Cyclospora cayetanensis]|uniref:Uncharacterized protein n=2 Tax=Cyclospora cayetanensis TaxID=88456 RepID=A0A1D3D6I4_9EIME|nr:uncharacterized protein LOC34624059 [Cyclospora cayetanensis]OEH79020.1 hypothetical protein cyc_08300 [Cyclospora cayetanensis]
MDSFKRRQESLQGAFGASSSASNGFLLSQQQSAPALGAPKRLRVAGGSTAAEDEGGGVSQEGTASKAALPVCLLVSENIAGALIGKGGCTVREFERLTGARIFVQRNAMAPHELAAAKQAVLETAGAPSQSQSLDVTKIVAIGGSKDEEVYGGLMRVLGLISSHPAHIGRSTAVLLVPQRSVGGIVGQRGRTIEELSQKSQAHIRVVPGVASPNGDRAVCFTAQHDDHVALAIQLMQLQLQQMVVTGRLMPSEFDYLVSLASVPQPKALRSAKTPPTPLGPPLPGVVSMGPMATAPVGAGGYYGANGTWGAPPSGPPPVQGSTPQGSVPGGSLGGSGVSGSRFVMSAEACGGVGCNSVLCFVIPQRLAAWVVGPQGTHVRAVREETGVQLQILDEVSGFTGEDARRMGRGAGGPFAGGGPGGPQADGAESSTERFCMVSGGVQSLCGAILRLGVPLQEKLQQVHQPLRLLIPFRFVSALIGSKGAFIRDMQHKSGATIQISKGSGAPEAGSAGPQGSWGGAPRDQHRIVTIEGPLCARLIALALVWQRILGVEYPDLSRSGAPFMCVSSLLEDLQQQGHDVSMAQLPPSSAGAPRMPPPPQQQQQPPFPGAEGAQYYDGAAAAAAAGAWGAPQSDPMAGVGGGPAPSWGSEDPAAAAGWNAPPAQSVAPTYEQMEGCFKGFCSRFLSAQEMAMCGERQTVQLLLSQAQGEVLLRRDSANARYGNAVPNAPPPNALDQISEMTGCHVRCFVTHEPIIQGAQGGPPQQQMVLIFTGAPVANSLAVMLAQARLSQVVA